MLVPGAHRVVRNLDKDEGPYTGGLVNCGSTVAVLVSAETISGWAGWEHAGSEHVAGPLDVVRRAEGHDVLLPWCTERIPAFLGRRTAIDDALSSGEVTTLVASVLRGIGELSRSERPETGDWWLTEDGRPMFVIGAGKDALIGAAEIIDRLCGGSVDRALGRLLVAISEGLQKRGDRPGIPRRQLERWEAELLDMAAPRPLRRDAHVPEKARDIDVVRRLRADPAVAAKNGAGATSRRAERRPVVQSDRTVDAITRRLEQWRRAVRIRMSRARGRRDEGAGRARIGGFRPVERSGAASVTGETRPSVPRSRKLLIAVVAVVVVLGGGLLWPGGATDEPDGASRSGTDASGTKPTDRPPIEGAAGGPPPSPVPSAVSSAVPSVSPSSPSDGDLAEPVAAAKTLLAAIDRCADTGDPVCADAVAGGAPGIVEALSGTGSGGSLQLTPVDVYGDVAVIRMRSASADGDGEGRAQHERMIVLVRIAEKWLVRDAYDVADQPG